VILSGGVDFGENTSVKGDITSAVEDAIRFSAFGHRV
jgi:hypothetical protein